MKCEYCKKGVFIDPDIVFIDKDEYTAVYHAECAENVLDDELGYIIRIEDDEIE